jgi:hypothetical protein
LDISFFSRRLEGGSELGYCNSKKLVPSWKKGHDDVGSDGHNWGIALTIFVRR